MTRRDLLYANRLSILLLLMFCATLALGQRKPKSINPLEGFLDTQFWLGLKIGGNVTQAFPETRFAGFSPIDYSPDSLEKSYSDFSLPGAHMGLEMNFYHRGFSVSFQPAYKRSRFEYSSQTSWRGALINNRFDSRFDVEQRLDVIELPLIIKYEIIQSGKIRPFVMAGGYHSRIASAQKEVRVTNTDFSSGRPLSSDGGATIIGVKDAFQPFSGVSGGIGVNLDYWNIRTVLEIQYQRGLTSATKPNVQENQFASLGEITDEVLLREINISLGFVFPFRFIDKQFAAY